MRKEITRVREYIRKRKGSRVSCSDLLRMTNVDAKTANKIIETLLEPEEIEWGKNRTVRRNNTLTYRIWYNWIKELD